MQNSIHARGVGTSLAPVPWNLRTLSQSAFPVTSSRVSTSAHAFFSRTSSGSSSCSLPYGSQVWLQPCRLGSYLHRPWRTSRVACKASTAAPLSAETAVSVRQSYRFHSKAGAVVDVCVEPGQTKTLVDIRVSYENASWGTPEQLQLHWGMFRASPVRWHHPKDVVPQGSTLDDATGGMRTPLLAQGVGGSGRWALSLDVPAKLAPVHLAFSLFMPAIARFDAPSTGHLHFCVPVGMTPGDPGVLGASVAAVGPGTGPKEAPCTVNFAVFSRHATAMQLSLIRLHPLAQQPAPPALPKSISASAKSASSTFSGGDDDDDVMGEEEGPILSAKSVLDISLDPHTNKTGDVWHIAVQGLLDLETLCWGWRVDGEIVWTNGNRFHPGFILMDPYATCASRVYLPENAHASAPRLSPGQDPTAPVVLGSLAACVTAPFDWKDGWLRAKAAAGGPVVPMSAKAKGPAGRLVPLEDSVMLWLDLDTFTQPSLAAAAGTIGGGAGGGVGQWPVPNERRGKYLGVLDRLQDILQSGVTSVVLSPVSMSSGSSGLPISLFAPEPRYAIGTSPNAAAHELRTLIHGLHAAGLEVLLSVEFCLMGESGDAGAGRLQGLRGIDHNVYYRGSSSTEDSLCVLNVGHPVTSHLVLSSLRHWATTYGVDGFHVRRAENLTQDRFGSVLDHAPLAEDIARDPVLRHLKLLAGVQSPHLLPRGGERGFPHWATWMQVNNRFRDDMLSYLPFNAHGKLSAVATRLAGSPDLFAERPDAGLPGGLAAARRPSFGINLLSPIDLDVTLQQVVDPNSENPQRAEALARALLVAQFMSQGAPALTSSHLTSPPTRALLALLALIRRTYRELITPPSYNAPRDISWHSAQWNVPVDWAGSNPFAPSNVLLMRLTGQGGRSLAVAFNPYPEPMNISLPEAPPNMAWRCVLDTLRGTPGPGGPTGTPHPLQGPPLPFTAQDAYMVGPLGAVILDAVNAGPRPMAAAGSAAGQGPMGQSGPPGAGLSPSPGVAAAMAAARKSQQQ